MEIDYSLESSSAEHDRAAVTDRRTCPTQFLLMNGDVLTDLNLPLLFCETPCRLTACLRSPRRDAHNTIDYGVLEVDGENRLSGFQENRPTNTW